MPLRKREPLPTIIRMKVINGSAPRTGESGWVVDTTPAPESELIYITLQFEPNGKPELYERSELELCTM